VAKAVGALDAVAYVTGWEEIEMMKRALFGDW